MQRRILKFKLTDSGKGNVSYLDIIDDDGNANKVDIECTNQVHPDLTSAFEELKIHMATICEQGDYTEFEDDAEKLSIYDVTQISLGGEDEHAGVTITGLRRLKDNRVLNLNAPFTKLNPDHSNYGYAASLDLTIQQVLSEVDQYLNGKIAPNNQLDLFMENPELPEEPVEKPMRKHRKLKKDHPLAAGLPEGTEVSIAANL